MLEAVRRDVPRVKRLQRALEKRKKRMEDDLREEGTKREKEKERERDH